MTLTYGQIFLIAFWPGAVWAIYLVGRTVFKLLRARYRSDNVLLHRGKIINILYEIPNPTLVSKYLEDWPDYDEHVKYIRKGMDVSVLYPAELRERVQAIVYGDDLLDFYNYMKTNDRKAFKRWEMIRNTKRRLGL